jgi:hypothetical protein
LHGQEETRAKKEYFWKRKKSKHYTKPEEAAQNAKFQFEAEEALLAVEAYTAALEREAEAKFQEAGLSLATTRNQVATADSIILSYGEFAVDFDPYTDDSDDIFEELRHEGTHKVDVMVKDRINLNAKREMEQYHAALEQVRGVESKEASLSHSCLLFCCFFLF